VSEFASEVWCAGCLLFVVDWVKWPCVIVGVVAQISPMITSVCASSCRMVLVLLECEQWAMATLCWLASRNVQVRVASLK
jgi:hypothetical protein